MAVSNPRDASPRRRASRGARLALMTAMIAVTATTLAVPAAPAAPAEAATVSSSLTVKWLGDTSRAAGDQPTRDASSPHYNEMMNISVTVSQTQQIIDQAIRVEVSGFAGTRPGGIEIVNGSNYIQAMQCWGDDPNAADFVETCQWGGRIPPVLGNTVYFDNSNRLAAKDFSPSPRTEVDNPFRTVNNRFVSAKAEIINGATSYPLLSYFGPATTNEVPVARIGTDGTGYFDFETQSSVQAPHMGCGTADHLRCWLVIVPRGTRFGGDGTDCSDLLDRNFEPYGYGDVTPIQGGSPVNPKCDYFDNRIVVPLDFTPTASSCPPGSKEFSISGSQFMIAAMSSWQPSLCQSISTTFSFATNPDSVARAQLLDTRTGSPELVYSGYPVSSGELMTDDERTLLGKTSLAYAPVAVSSVVVAYNAEFANGRPGGLNLTPRLMAKLLTQSYTFTVPSSTAFPAESVAHLSAAARTYRYWNDDPEFRAANPTNWQLYDQQVPSILLPGPAGADGIKQVWRWILADPDAVAFLKGEDDGHGMTVNPYFLPRTETNLIPWYYDATMSFTPTPTTKMVGQVGIDGAPYSLAASPRDTFPKYDGTQLPFITSEINGRTRYDTIQFAPYALDYLSAARQAFRGDPNSKTLWDQNKIEGEVRGAWVSTGVQDVGSRFMIAVTDSANASRYGLTTAALAPAGSDTPVASTEATMTAALSSLSATTIDTILQVDPAKVGDPATTGVRAYPLTMITYAGVNLSKSSFASRKTIADMIQQVVTTGQVSGTAIGELPAGYVPLSTTLQDQAKATVQAVLTWSPPSPTPTPSPSAQLPTYPLGGGDGDLSGGGETGDDPTVTPGVDAQSGERTLASTTGPIERSGLAIALILGVLGMIGAPLVLRRRGYL